MSRIHCSACGEQGHNRRNRRCRVNRARRAEAVATEAVATEPTTPVNPPPLIEVRANRSFSLLRTVLNNLNELTETVRQYQQAEQTLSGQPLTTFIFGCIAKTDTICKTMSRFLLEYNDIGTVAPQQLFTQLEEQVQLINGFIQRDARSSVRILVSFVEQRFLMTMTDIASYPYPSAVTGVATRVPLVKRTSAYLKEISLTQVVTEDSHCECPICFDEMPSEDAVFTGCKHPYCVTCIKGLATSIKDNTKKPCCSLCRTEITQLSFGKVEIRNEISQHFYNL